jgi:hypothetical protein
VYYSLPLGQGSYRTLKAPNSNMVTYFNHASKDIFLSNIKVREPEYISY